MPLHPRSQGAAAPCGAGRRCSRWPSGPATWCRSAAAASGGRSRWPTRASAGARSRRRPCGRRSSTSARARTRRSTGTPRTPSASSSRAKASGRSSTATRSRCAAATSCRTPAGTSTATTTRPTRRWPGSTAWTSRSQHYTDAPFFEFGPDEVGRPSATPERSRSERLWGHPGLRPLSRSQADSRPRRCWPTAGSTPTRPPRPARARGRGLRRHRRAGPRRGPLHQPDHRRRRAADHPRRVPPAARRAHETAPRREVGSSVCQVFDGRGTVHRRRRRPGRSSRGDLFVVPSWAAAGPIGGTDDAALDLFRFSDAPIFERLAPRTAPHVDRRRPMKLATIRTRDGHPRRPASTATGRRASAHADVGALLARPDWRDRAAAADGAAARARPARDLAPVVPRPGKIVCVGLNYRNHILEMGRELPEYPTLFAKYRRGADRRRRRHRAARRSPTRSTGRPSSRSSSATPVRRADDERGRARRSPGYTVLNDVTMRDWQYRTRSGCRARPSRPPRRSARVLVTPDELPGGVGPR